MRADAGALHFRPRLWPTLAAFAALVVLLGLGTWQVERLHWKEALIAERAAQLAAPPETLPPRSDNWRAWDFRRVSATGTFQHAAEQLYGVAAIEGRLGYHLLTPLVRPDGAAILVDRGWVPADQAQAGARGAGEIEGRVTVTGIARYRGGDRPSWLIPDNEPERKLWFSYDLPALETATGLELLPVVVEADATPNPGGLPIGGQTRVELPNNHLQYAITWYGLAAALVGVYLAFSCERDGKA